VYDTSREAAQECSLGRKPWVSRGIRTSPEGGERRVLTHTTKGRKICEKIAAQGLQIAKLQNYPITKFPQLPQ
jgi:hypothetical protein